MLNCTYDPDTQRVDVTMGDGERWWAAPVVGRGDVMVLPCATNRRPGTPLVARSIPDGLRALLGDAAEDCLTQVEQARRNAAAPGGL